jgi:pectin methylesterase-like acyl-CoA thioesterase
MRSDVPEQADGQGNWSPDNKIYAYCSPVRISGYDQGDDTKTIQQAIDAASHSSSSESTGA